MMGLFRTLVFSHYLGTSDPAGAFTTALRIPHTLQNLFGEGVLSASFIPVYGSLVGKKEREEADVVAGAVFGLLTLVMGVFVAVGMLSAPTLASVFVKGEEHQFREL